LEIRLERAVWRLDESARLGAKGGFGEVFRGIGPDGPVAIKRLNISAEAAAHRELSIGKVLASKPLDHVVPILDYGQDPDSDRYFLVMPICEESLHDKLKREGPLDWASAQEIVLDIVAGLQEVGDIVHRDLKPGNVLLHEDRWKIADFGIAKFVEDSTSLETLRSALTPSYAAPEQWMGLRPTSATDVYALGCIIHAILNGHPPFRGDVDSVRNAHLHSPPPDLKGVEPRLASLVNAMLRKVQEVRPNLDRCLRVITNVRATQSGARGLLVEAALRVSQEEAAKEAQQREIEATRKARAAMVTEAIESLKSLMQRLFDEIESSSENASRSDRAIVLGPAHLMFDPPERIDNRADPNQSGWDVAAASKIVLRCQMEPLSYGSSSIYTFSASLVFCKTPKDPEHRWREVSFWSFRSDNSSTPYAINPRDREFSVALSNVAGMTSVAHGPLAIDAEDEIEFLDRWLILFAKAADRRLRHPMQMPPPPQFFKA
jgi:serine/threonine-protein kinase